VYFRLTQLLKVVLYVFTLLFKSLEQKFFLKIITLLFTKDEFIYVCVCVCLCPSVPPNIMGEEVNKTVLMGLSVQLHCQSDAIPPPALSWRKDGRPLYRKPGLSLSEDGSFLKVQ